MFCVFLVRSLRKTGTAPFAQNPWDILSLLIIVANSTVFWRAEGLPMKETWACTHSFLKLSHTGNKASFVRTQLLLRVLNQPEPEPLLELAAYQNLQ